MKKLSGTHERLVREEALRGSTDRAFGLVFAAVFAIVGLWPLLGDGGLRLWSLAVSFAFFAVALARPATLAPLNRQWMRLGLLLHRVVNPIVMGILFFLVVTPTGLAMRLLGKDILRLRFDEKAESYWIERQPPGPVPETMKDQF